MLRYERHLLVVILLAVIVLIVAIGVVLFDFPFALPDT